LTCRPVLVGRGGTKKGVRKRKKRPRGARGGCETAKSDALKTGEVTGRGMAEKKRGELVLMIGGRLGHV